MKKTFRLELPDKQIVRKSQKRLIFTKNEYQPGVKVTNWEQFALHEPVDNDPYCPGALNYFLSHYNRLGNTTPDERYATTTQIMLGQIHMKTQINKVTQNLNKNMVNYFTFKDTLACNIDLKDNLCPEICAESYLTTMQKSYTPPYPYTMPRFSCSTIPFLQYRKFKWEDPITSENTFYDEGYNCAVSKIQKTKGFLTKSYDPANQKYSDGSLEPERTQRCFKLDYLK